MKKQSKGHNKIPFVKRKHEVGMTSSTNTSNYEENYNKMMGAKSGHHKSKKKLKKVLLIILCVILGIALIVTGVFGILYYKGKSQFKQEKSEIKLPSSVQAEQDGNIIQYNGKKYTYDENVNTILCIGVDKDTKTQEKTDYFGTAGQADALYLICIDNEEKQYNVISINRDSMIDIDVYDTAGKYVGVVKDQACVSYAYGDGKEESCENTVKAVSRMLYNIPINSYFSINKACIPLLNDMIGGVTVPVYDSNGNKTGESKYLSGNDAYKYIQYRDTSKIDSNLVRIKRQTSYIKAFFSKAVEQTKEDLSTPLILFETVSLYSTTTLNASKITYLTTNALSDRNDIKLNFNSIAGKVKKGKDGFAEFHINNDKLMELVINIFYDEVK